MSVTINGEKVEGILGYLIALPIVILTFLWLAVTFLAVALVLLSPLLIVLGLLYLALH